MIDCWFKLGLRSNRPKSVLIVLLLVNERDSKEVKIYLFYMNSSTLSKDSQT